MTLAALALWALVIALGVQTGAGLYETRVVVPLWSASPPESIAAFLAQTVRPDSGRRLWIFLTPLTGIICLLNLALALLTKAEHFSWWLTASSIGIVVIVVTFAYFVPVLLKLPKASERPADEVRRQIKLWVGLNYVRLAALIVAWLAALKAFSS
jgi:uncharacterized membrane protein